MKRLITLLVATSITVSANADEGMWLLPQMERVNYATMREKGLQLSAEQIYSASQPSIKDAIVIFGRGCTGEIVSPNGLLFTNHHCGYGSIQMLSSVESDYLRDGFWALDEQGEIPVPGLEAKFIRSIIDVTPEVLGSVPSTASQVERERIVNDNIKRLTKEFDSNKLFIARVEILLRGSEQSGVEELLTSLRAIKDVEYATATTQGDFVEISAMLRSSLSERNAANVYNDLKGVVEASALSQRVMELSPLYTDFKAKGNMISIKPFFGDNQYFMFIMENYTDIRLVGTPPQSIGKFGGETDNWMWPRHTGDFAIFRVYADKDNRPAEYSPSNRPYQSDEHLKISIAGYDEGDFTMILGFPGSTQRYMTSYEIDEVLEVINPQRISIREARQEILSRRMAAEDRVRIQYASKYASSSNYWKNAMGMSRGLRRLNVREAKVAQQESFQQWATQNTLPQEGYINALSLIEEGKSGAAGLSASLQYLSEAALMGINITTIAHALEPRFIDNASRKEREGIVSQIEELYKDYDEATEREVSVKMVEMMRDNMEHKPTIFAEIIESSFQGDAKRYVDYLYDNSHFSSAERAKAFAMEYNTSHEFSVDPAAKFSLSVYDMIEQLRTEIAPYSVKVREGHRLYVDGMMKQSPEKIFSPDANFTIRLSYGQVLPYSPADGIMYNYQTTLKGVIDKEDVTNPTEFTVEERLKEIYRNGEYGAYADKSGAMPVGFLSNNDITGGNSGSPVLNAKGELIGLAFDGNWEAMSGDIAFESELQRTISVDVRYLLLILDHYAGARWLLDELTIVQ